MKLSRFGSALVAVVLLTPALFAAEDLTGKWTGAFVTSMNGGEPKDDVAYMVIKHAGAELTGTAGPSVDQQWPIVSGKVTVATVAGKESTKISFDVQLANGPLLHFDLELVDGHLKGNAKAEQDGMMMTAKVDVTRSK